MADGIGLSIGATVLAAVAVGRAAVRRTPVLTLFDHRPPEVGLPSENPNLDERGLVLTDFVDRVGDPVGILAPDGSSHRGEQLTADALRALLYGLTRGRQPVEPIAVTHPAHWAPGAVEALRTALAGVAEFGAGTPVISDAEAALTALQADPGLPSRGIVALCDFGGTGTTVTLADAAHGYRPIAPPVRHRELSGDLIDQALLTHVLADLQSADDGDLTGTSAIGPLTRLRGQCRAAKERLSTDTVTSLTAELAGRTSEVRLNRTELDTVVHAPLAEFVAMLQSTLERTGIPAGDLAAVATTGGLARIPIVTTTLSENFRVPVITTPQPELTAAIGGGLTAARGPDEQEHTALAAAAVPPVAAADPDQSSTFRALAWSAADDSPDVVPTDYDPADYEPGAYEAADPRPPVQFGADDPDARPPAPIPWYRRPAAALALGVVAVLAALAAAVYFVNSDDDTAPAATTTTTTATTAAPAPAAPPETAPPPPAETPAPQPEAPQTRTVTRPAPAPAPEAPPPPPPTTEAPPPPPPTTTPPPPTTTAPPPTTTAPPPLIPTLPYTTIPGLPFVPAPPGLGGG
jgi:hypothetical protein